VRPIAGRFCYLSVYDRHNTEYVNKSKSLYANCKGDLKKMTPKPRTAPRPGAKTSIRSAFAQRLRQATEKHDIADLAVKIGVTPVTLYRWLSAKFDPSLAKLAQLADAMEVNLGWLVTGTGPVDSRRALRHARLADYETAEYAATEGGSDQAPIAFHEPWLFELLYGTHDEPTLFGTADMKPPLLMEVLDDSMEPTIKKGALLLIDRSFGIGPKIRKRPPSEARSAYDGIYVFRLGSSPDRVDGSSDHLVVRRVQYRLDGTMVVTGDNPKYPVESYPPDAPNRPKPLGRAVWGAGRI
jgi:phage repressor protein C with HTH and peptisase S24 domain